jgi:hypothetical protein
MTTRSTLPDPDAGSSAAELDDLLERLSTIPKGSNLREALSLLQTPQPTGSTEASRRCALLRWFDARLYGFVCADVDDHPLFDNFVEGEAVQRLGPGRSSLDEGTRARLLKEWQSKPDEWKGWNQRLGEYFLKDPDPNTRLDALYYLAASPRPEAAVPYFRKWYAESDAAFDMAQCNALLEILRLQQNWRGPALSGEWDKYRQYYSARMLFVDDYYKTGSYFHRQEPLTQFTNVVKAGTRSPDDPWIFHIHATGGTGKTMFLRWLISRHLVPQHIACARVDFDDFKLREVVDYPLSLFVRIVDQWSRQVEGTTWTSLLEKLNREQQTPGWNQGLLAEVRRQLRGSGIHGPIIVVLDTLEEATIAAAEWLKDCVAALRAIHNILPNLTLVLSGRYDLSKPRREDKVQSSPKIIEPGEYVKYELLRFTEDEAYQYLANRGIPEGDVRAAIVARADAAEEPDTEGDSALAGRNPFKLAIFAELVLNRRTLTADDVMKFPRADIAYLIERVITRIESQPMRWVIRYGAIARHLTVDFIDNVLVPPLRMALRGDLPDQANEALGDAYQDVWRPEPALADSVSGTGLWDQLKSYARERGWIAAVGTGDRSELRFHPEVIGPMRDLLRSQPVFSDLQQRACTFFETEAQRAEGDTRPFEARAADAVRHTCEAVFHRFQLEGSAAQPYWLLKVRTAERHGPAYAIDVATEITGKDYSEARRFPLPQVSTPQTLVAAHCESADLLMQAAGLDFSDTHPRWFDFRQHIEIADLIAQDHPEEPELVVPPLLRAIYDAFRSSAPEECERVLRLALSRQPTPRDHFFLSLFFAKHLTPYPAGF